MDSDSESREHLTKNFMKTMPIWEYFDGFRSQVELFQYDLKEYLGRLNKRGQRVANLPSLNTTNTPRILPKCESQNDMDVVKIYKKTSDGYMLFDKKKREELRRKAEHDPYRDESILMLEEKIKVDEEVYAAGNHGAPWVKCKIVSVFRKRVRESSTEPIIIFRLKTQTENGSRLIDVNKYSVARVQDHSDLLKPSKRVIAGEKRDNMRPGIIGEEPTPMNKLRYLVHLDDGSAKYFSTDQVLPILGQTPYPWQDARNLGHENPLNEAYLRYIFSNCPQRLIMKVAVGDKIELTRNGVLVPATVEMKDKSVMVIAYKDGHRESIYRGSPRLTKRQDILTRQLRSVRDLTKFDNRLLVHMHLYSEASRRALDEDLYKFFDDFNKKILISKNHNTARKSTGGAKRAKSPERIRVDLDGELVEENREVVELNGNGDKKHTCSPDCLDIPDVKTETSIKDIVDEFRHVSDLKVPLMFGWKRKLCRVPPPTNTRNGKSRAVIVYESPCGRVFQALHLIRRHLIAIGSKFDIDYFSFEREVELNRPIGTCETYKYLENIAVDAKTGEPLENKHISLMNQFSEECLPEDFEYRNETFPHPLLEAKNFSFNQEFKSGCDCEDDCQQRTTCSCHNLNEEFFGRVRHTRGSVERKCQYTNKRLNEQVPTGIFECNSFCKCSSKCSNRVVQNGMRFRLQVQKTLNKGWGVITLDDIPKGAFICTYAAELLDDADQYGDSDMYYADLDYISVNEEMKLNLSDSDEGVGKSDNEETKSDPPKKKSKNTVPTSNETEDSQDEFIRNDADDKSSGSSSSVEEVISDYLPRQPNSGQSRYPKRKHNKDKISQIAPGKNTERAPRFLKIHDILQTHDFTLDARMQGNVGRFFNHSCDPNATVQNVFIRTQDLRFPEVAFFAIRTIKAMGEITWNYNYKMGSIDGRRIECHCGASNCRGRIL